MFDTGLLVALSTHFKLLCEKGLFITVPASRLTRHAAFNVSVSVCLSMCFSGSVVCSAIVGPRPTFFDPTQ